MSTRIVLDASVIVKALLPSARHETDRPAAVAILQAVGDAALEPLQPPHWLAEVTAVLARLSPETAEARAELLYAMELSVLDEPDLYVEACRLATRLNHHLFDTLYHAVARCEPAAVYVTADETYYRKAHALGGITLLRDFRPV